MGLLSRVLTLPVKGPVDATLWIAGKVSEAAEQRLNDPATLKSALQDAERRLLAGELSEEAYDEIESEILMRLRAVG